MLMDIYFKPSNVTLDLINICLETPSITRSQLINKSHTEERRQRSWSLMGGSVAVSVTYLLDLSTRHMVCAIS